LCALIKVPREETHKPNMQLSVKKLYLGGVKEPITENDLKDYFSQFGSITDVVVMKDRDGQYRGYRNIHFNFIN
jgi:RNA recognition motif-containing protein